MDSDWFKTWFGSSYQHLYAHRSLKQAKLQANLVLSRIQSVSCPRILDIACGAGRHLKAFSHSQCDAWGVDLSWDLLREARAQELKVVRADMRKLPFPEDFFELVTCFFTSFGYFASEDEDAKALSGFSYVLKPGGYLFLDLMNATYVQAKLIPRDEKIIEGVKVEQIRRIENKYVVKDIRMTHPSGGTEQYREKVRLYSLEEALSLVNSSGLKMVEVFGDESGNKFVEKETPRMSLFLRKLD